MAGLEETHRRVAALYSANLAEHGAGSRSVGWPDADAHRLRFERLARVLEAEPPDGPYTVCDWGCGLGALFGFLDARPGDLAAYRGYDLSPEMLAAARAQVRDPRAAFVLGSAVGEDADYTIVSGTFNVRLEAPEAEWAEHVRATLRTLWARTRRGLAFNLLTSHVDWRDPHLFYADPAEWTGFCASELSRRVVLQHDYPLFEWTLLVLRAAPRER